ncbi:MAG: hypothetical protein V1771_04930 [Chloroflexota bacterium]
MTKRRDIYLYLTLLCFFAIIAIFVVDGYMGVYDTINITAGERPQKIDPDFWLRPEAMTYETRVVWGEKVFFSYEIANHRLTGYTAEVNASVWRSQEKVRDLVTQPLTINALSSGQVEWSIDTAELVPGGVAQGQSVQYSIRVKRDNIERRIILNINPGSFPVPPKPAIRPIQPG